MNTEESIQREIRRRAFERADQEERIQGTQHTIDALQEVTGLPRLELETIAGEVRASFEANDKDFFSIKRQFIMVFSAFVALLISVWFLVLWTI